MVKAAKISIHYAIADSRISASEFLTLCAEVANILNERPIGLIPGADSDINILTPNCLILGRPIAANPGGYTDKVSTLHRLQVIESVMNDFWRRWTDLYAPTMVKQSKWHDKVNRNLRIGDVVVVADSNALRGRYFIAKVVEIYPSSDGQVRKVALEYKSFRVGKRVSDYVINRVIRIIRSVRRLALLVPCED